MPVDGRLPAVDETFTIAPPPRSRIAGSDRADRAHVAHHVQLPRLLPLLVGHLVERRAGSREADVVDEHVDRPSSRRLGDHAARARPARDEVGRDVERLADARRLARGRTVDDPGALLGEQPRGLEPDPAGRAGDDADAVARPRSTAR